MRLNTSLVLVCLEALAGSAAADTAVHLRANQVGYLPGEEKIAVAFSNAAVTGEFSLIEDGREQAAFTGKIAESPVSGWGLEWILKLHPQPTHLYHQVADDRDHLGWKMPNEDKSDYGWGPNSYRVVYFADGKPQGLRKHKSQATGVANLAGRCAAALAAAHRVWTRDLHEPEFAAKCLRAAEELYAMGRAQEGYQQGNSYGAPYRYSEKTCNPGIGSARLWFRDHQQDADPHEDPAEEHESHQERPPHADRLRERAHRFVPFAITIWYSQKVADAWSQSPVTAIPRVFTDPNP